MTRHLIVFAKEPRLGRVKSRLARDVGRVEAWRFYRWALADLLRRLGGDRRWRTTLCVTPAAACASPVWQTGIPRAPQESGNLGRRMQAAIDAVPPGPVLLIGADIPAVRPRHIADAFRQLGDNDAVFGPATDGGYWLVGFKRSPRTPAPFEGVRWSSEHALADTLANLKGKRVGYVEMLTDIDDGADHARWRACRSRLN